jgi:hypothetical protein
MIRKAQPGDLIRFTRFLTHRYVINSSVPRCLTKGPEPFTKEIKDLDMFLLISKIYDQRDYSWLFICNPGIGVTGWIYEHDVLVEVIS